MQFILEPFHYDFMVRALVAGLVVGTVAPLLGQFMVVRRYSLFPDTLSHVALFGIAVGLLLGIQPVLGALITSVIAALLMERLRGKKTHSLQGDTTLALFLSGSLAAAVVIIGLLRTVRIDLSSLLFGSITTIGISELWWIGGIGVTVLALVLWGYAYLFAVSFDEDNARVQGMPVGLINSLLMIGVALVVSVAIRAVGALLIGALMVIPVLTASMLQKSFKATMGRAILYAWVAVIAGLFISYYLGVASGGAIVLVSLALYVAVLLTHRV